MATDNDDYHARIVAGLPFGRLTVAGSQAWDAWQRLRGAGRGWPVVIGDDRDLERVAEQFSIAPTFGGGVDDPVAILERAASLRFPEDLHRWLAEEGEELIDPPVGEWPSLDEPIMPALSVAGGIHDGKPLDQVHILLVPAQHGWEVPAYLRWGGWNSCPPPDLHVAALRTWNELYGAELVGLNGDTLNLSVTQQPAGRTTALALARELYRYCPDLIDQGAGSLSVLAAGLMTGYWWYFWWD